ncbi:MAG: sensor histidine kinase [Polymorphobacter sp.]|uniref:sensor histidine kinase n=1 Tax=Polymorphobacter sp. TaxID=1909290 RepID=UPI003A89CD09
MSSLRRRIGLSIGGIIVVAAIVTLGFVAVELKEIEAGDTLDPAHVEYAELLLVLLPFAIIAPVAGMAVAGWSLRPLSDSVEHLKRIGPDQPEMRLDPGGLPEEVKPFVTATNHALDRLADAYLNERRLAADAAHALRTPLATARLRIDTAMAGHPVDVAGLTADLDRMSRAISQVLAMARLDAARLDASEARVIDAARLCRGIAAEFLPLADRMGRSLVVEAEAPAPVVAADLDEALRNLVSNALHHGQGAVTLCAAASEQGITISVIDEGPGVAEADRKRLRERFAKGQSSNGSGLGLAIASAIVDRAGGTLVWRKNAKLEVQLPRARKPDETA